MPPRSARAVETGKKGPRSHPTTSSGTRLAPKVTAAPITRLSAPHATSPVMAGASQLVHPSPQPQPQSQSQPSSTKTKESIERSSCLDAVVPNERLSVSLQTATVWRDLLLRTGRYFADAVDATRRERSGSPEVHDEKPSPQQDTMKPCEEPRLASLETDRNASVQTGTAVRMFEKAFRSLEALVEQMEGTIAAVKSTTADHGEGAAADPSLTASSLLHSLSRERAEAAASHAALMARLRAADETESRLRREVADEFQVTEKLARAIEASAHPRNAEAIDEHAEQTDMVPRDSTTRDQQQAHDGERRLGDEQVPMEASVTPLSNSPQPQSPATDAERGRSRDALWRLLQETLVREKALIMEGEADARESLRRARSAEERAHLTTHRLGAPRRGFGAASTEEALRMLEPEVLEGSSASLTSDADENDGIGLVQSTKRTIPIPETQKKTKASVSPLPLSQVSRRPSRTPIPGAPKRFSSHRLQQTSTSRSPRPETMGRAADKTADVPWPWMNFPVATADSTVAPISPLLLYDEDVARDLKSALEDMRNKLHADYESRLEKLRERHEAERAVWRRRLEQCEQERQRAVAPQKETLIIEFEHPRRNEPPPAPLEEEGGTSALQVPYSAGGKGSSEVAPVEDDPGKQKKRRAAVGIRAPEEIAEMNGGSEGFVSACSDTSTWHEDGLQVSHHGPLSWAAGPVRITWTGEELDDDGVDRRATNNGPYADHSKRSHFVNTPRQPLTQVNMSHDTATTTTAVATVVTDLETSFGDASPYADVSFPAVDAIAGGRAVDTTRMDAWHEREEALLRAMRAARAALCELQLRNDQLETRNRVLRRELEDVSAPTPRSLIGTPFDKAATRRIEAGLGEHGASPSEDKNNISRHTQNVETAISRSPLYYRDPRFHVAPERTGDASVADAAGYERVLSPAHLPPYPGTGRLGEEKVNPTIWIASSCGEPYADAEVPSYDESSFVLPRVPLTELGDARTQSPSSASPSENSRGTGSTVDGHPSESEIHDAHSSTSMDSTEEDGRGHVGAGPGRLSPPKAPTRTPSEV